MMYMGSRNFNYFLRARLGEFIENSVLNAKVSMFDSLYQNTNNSLRTLYDHFYRFCHRNEPPHGNVAKANVWSGVHCIVLNPARCWCKFRQIPIIILIHQPHFILDSIVSEWNSARFLSIVEHTSWAQIAAIIMNCSHDHCCVLSSFTQFSTHRSWDYFEALAPLLHKFSNVTWSTAGVT